MPHPMTVPFYTPQPVRTVISSNLERWSSVAEHVTECVGSVSLGGHMGFAVLIGRDRAIIPRHLVDGQCPQNFRVTFSRPGAVSATHIDHYKIVRIFAARGDFAIVQLTTGQFETQKYPGDKFAFPRRFKKVVPGEEVMLVHGKGINSKDYSFGALFRCTVGDSDFCSFSNTLPGSSGGAYFDLYGNLVAIHLSRGTGLCGPNSHERRSVLFEQIWNETFLSDIPRCQLLSPPKRPLQCLAPQTRRDVCYNDEAKRPFLKNDCVFSPGVRGSCLELRFAQIKEIGGNPRGISFTFSGITTSFIFMEDPHFTGGYRADAQTLYLQALVKFIERYRQNLEAAKKNPNVMLIPEDFEFKAYGKKFTASRTYKDKTGQFPREIL